MASSEERGQEEVGQYPDLLGFAGVGSRGAGGRAHANCPRCTWPCGQNATNRSARRRAVEVVRAWRRASFFITLAFGSSHTILNLPSEIAQRHLFVSTFQVHLNRTGNNVRPLQFNLNTPLPYHSTTAAMTPRRRLAPPLKPIHLPNVHRARPTGLFQG